MKLLGYSDIWSARAGEQIQFMVSSEEGDYDVGIVRLFQVDDRPSAPEYREEIVAADCNGHYPGRKQALRPGSFLRVANHKILEAESFSFTAWIRPTAFNRGLQGIFGKKAAAGGIDISISEAGLICFELGETTGKTVILEASLSENAWYFLVAQYDASRKEATLWLKPKNARASQLTSVVEPAHASASADAIVPNGEDVLIGALHGPDGAHATARFNGKIGSPSVYHRALSLDEIAKLYAGSDDVKNGLSARWDLSAFPFGLTVPDRSGHDLSATVINNPMRGVTGAFWDGTADNFQTNPKHYDAIYFHDDDIDDAGWDVDFAWRIPEGTPSGVYAARLRTKNDEDYLPFVVCPTRATAPTLFILPTFTYQAYANERFHAQPFVEWSMASDLPLKLSRQDAFSAATPELGCSIYDVHTDGSFNCSSSMRRPVVNFRPKSTAYWNGAGRHFGADMYLVDWLDRSGFAHDVATDHDVHAGGLELLSQYKVIVLGTHPEYFSWPMRIALEEFVAQGGRLMYLGGNGGWWVTGVDPARPYVIEVRKAFLNGTGAGLGVETGEEYLSTSGLKGASWRAAGRSPESLFGVGFTAQGFCSARSYRRMPDSFDPNVQFIFEGIGDDEIIGDFGLALGGAAGDEFDRAIEGGSPPNTYILASSSGHPKKYCQNLTARAYEVPEKQEAVLRSDLTYYETPGGGAVFSAGSMCWCTSLPHNGYDNNVSRLTGNVLRHFLSNAP